MADADKDRWIYVMPSETVVAQQAKKRHETKAHPVTAKDAVTAYRRWVKTIGLVPRDRVFDSFGSARLADGEEKKSRSGLPWLTNLDWSMGFAQLITITDNNLWPMISNLLFRPHGSDIFTYVAPGELTVTFGATTGTGSTVVAWADEATYTDIEGGGAGTWPANLPVQALYSNTHTSGITTSITVRLYATASIAAGGSDPNVRAGLFVKLPGVGGTTPYDILVTWRRLYPGTGSIPLSVVITDISSTSPLAICGTSGASSSVNVLTKNDVAHPTIVSSGGVDSMRIEPKIDGTIGIAGVVGVPLVGSFLPVPVTTGTIPLTINSTSPILISNSSSSHIHKQRRGRYWGTKCFDFAVVHEC
jgi:hypothetical protein